MKKNYNIKQNIVLIECGDEFAILNRHPSDDGIYGVTLSIRPTSEMIQSIEDTGIVSVESFNENGTFTFTRKPFFETHLMIEILTDILEKYGHYEER